MNSSRGDSEMICFSNQKFYANEYIHIYPQISGDRQMYVFLL